MVINNGAATTTFCKASFLSIKAQITKTIEVGKNVISTVTPNAKQIFCTQRSHPIFTKFLESNAVNSLKNGLNAVKAWTLFIFTVIVSGFV